MDTISNNVKDPYGPEANPDFIKQSVKQMLSYDMSGSKDRLP